MRYLKCFNLGEIAGAEICVAFRNITGGEICVAFTSVYSCEISHVKKVKVRVLYDIHISNSPLSFF